jgi:hypothetical protein
VNPIEFAELIESVQNDRRATPREKAMLALIMELMTEVDKTDEEIRRLQGELLRNSTIDNHGTHT